MTKPVPKCQECMEVLRFDEETQAWVHTLEPGTYTDLTHFQPDNRTPHAPVLPAE